MATTQAQGVNAVLAWVRETVWGTTPTTPAMIAIPFETESLSHAQTRIQRSNLSATRNPRKPTTGRAGAQGDVSVLLNPMAHGYLLADQLGAPVTTGAGSPYTHTYKVGTAAPVGATLEKGFTDVPSYHPFTGSRGVGLTLKVGDSGPVEAAFRYACKGEGTASGTPLDASPTELADVPFDAGNANVTITEGGASIATVTTLEVAVEIEAGTDSYAIAGAGARAALPVGNMKVTGKITALFDSLTLYQKAKAGTESAIVISLAHGTGAGTEGNEKITLTLPEIVYDTNTPAVQGPAGVLWEGPFTAYYDNNADATALKVELMNAHPAYG